ncbi:unnamed protein product [Paramecium sonneborni]|uniref:Uncharacterized protein n=1 Tax=Paramecium sonneborni TaxID=65129 RepID=A0A8S1QZM6_9CILI|nr:unnamed protein product [Paramecium sonneborni]
MNNSCDLELKSQILQLQNDKDRIKNQYQIEILEMNTKIQELETKLQIQKEEQMKLKQENLQLENHLSKIDSKIVETNPKEQCCCLHQKQQNNKKKIQYLIEKLNVKSTQNAKLHYELIKLQNNVELLETQTILQSNNNKQIIKQDKQSISDVYQYLDREVQAPIQIQNKIENIKTSMVMQQKQSLSNQSINHSQSDQNKNMNFSTLITPQAKKNNVSNSIHKNLTLHQAKTVNFKEDIIQQTRKIHTKNSISIGELNIFKQDQRNYQNILQKMMKKESLYSPGKQIHATQKFKEVLDSKLNNISDKQKSYCSLLFSGRDFYITRNGNAYPRQNSLHINEDRQYKSKLFSQKLHLNSRKQSETIKSEESQKLCTDQNKYQNLFECINYKKKGKIKFNLDIFQMMKDIHNQNIRSSYADNNYQFQEKQIIKKNSMQNMNSNIIFISRSTKCFDEETKKNIKYIFVLNNVQLLLSLNFSYKSYQFKDNVFNLQIYKENVIIYQKNLIIFAKYCILMK